MAVAVEAPVSIHLSCVVWRVSKRTKSAFSFIKITLPLSARDPIVDLDRQISLFGLVDSNIHLFDS